MPAVTVGQENNTDIEIYYEDHGAGQPVVLIHGYPLSGRAWDKQVPALLEAGHRVITYDRRGFGRSSQPVTGYDYDTFAADLHALLEHLDLRDAVLAGHSMGTGEVTRYLGSYGPARVAKGVLVSPIPPYLLATPDNPDGVPQALFDGFIAAAQADTPAWMKGFLDTFYNMDTLRGTLVSDQAWQASWNLAVTASAAAAVASIRTWTTDFRDDLPKIDVPVLVLHGDADQVLPIDKTSKRLPGLIKDMHLTVIEGGPHAIPWTHADQVNTALLDFLRRGDAMAEKKTLVVYAAVYETVEAALADLGTIEQLHKDELIGQYDAAVIDHENGKPHVVKRMDRPHIRVIPEWFGGGTLPRKELREAAEELTTSQAGLIAVGEPTTEKGLDKAFTGAVNVVKRAVDATTGEITSELQEALKDA